MFFCLSYFVMEIFDQFREIPLSQKFHIIRDFPNFKADSRPFITRVGVGMGFFRDPGFFLFWARSKNPENPGDRDRHLKIQKKS